MKVKGIGSWMTRYSETQPDKLAVISGDNYLTYEKFNQRINQLANGLTELGIRKGDRVNGLLLNTNESLETLFACAKLGAIYVPINFRLSPQEVAYIVRDSSSSVFIYDYRLVQVADAVESQVDHLHHLIHVGLGHESHINYEQWLEEQSSDEPNHDIGLEDPHLMMYTSGTTGRPKGALLTHNNTIWNAINAIVGVSVESDDITLTVAPLFHIAGMNIFTTPTFYKGGTILLQDQFNPVEILQAIESEKVTTVFLVPEMWAALTQVPNFKKYDLSSLRLNVSGAAPCPVTVIEFFQSKGIPFMEGFGLTETAPFVAVLDNENSVRKNGSVGKPPIHVDIKIVDEDDDEVSVGEVGELLVKGPNVFREYWNNPAETAKALKNGWFYTGDLAKQDEEGFLYIVDRKKDMIISGGENVYPIEVEQVLYRHPSIQDVAVIGYPDEQWGESVKAFVVLKEDHTSLELEDVETFSSERLAKFKVPKKLKIIDELPRNATGKVLKTVLRAETQNELS